MLLALETSTKACSVALHAQGKVLAQQHLESDQYVHSEKLHIFIREVLDQAAVKPAELTAVAVGKGPGSYTGLRIGVSAAKGLCYALKIPLVSANGPEILMQQALYEAKLPASAQLFIPMIDARRNEVYQAVYNHKGLVEEIKASVVAQDSFESYAERYQRVHLFGDGADKFTDWFAQDSLVKVHSGIRLNAWDLALVASQKLAQGQTEDVAYFEPFYLKDFIALKPKNPFF